MGKSSTGASKTSTKLIEGSVYRGRVTTVKADGTYTVRLSAPRKTISKVRAATPLLGGLLGFNVRGRVAPGTDVLLVHGPVSFLFSIADDGIGRPIPPRSATGAAVQGFDFGIPGDMVEGEFEIGNDFGVAMQFLTTLMRMSAGGRATIEVHALNGMLRLISEQFRHISPLGDELMFDHGRPTLERSWSSYRHELFDLAKASDPLGERSGDLLKLTPEERVAAVGKHRLLEFMGFAGDFVHSFITDPSASASRLNAERGDSAGKSWLHRNSDGSVVIQSVADIALERVCAIPVPFRIAPHEDQATAASRHYDKLQAEYLKDFNFGSSDPKKRYRTAYQLRAYARWLSRYHSLARVLQLPGDYDLKTESEAATPSWGNREADRELTTGPYVQAYAAIRIMRDGSISMLDAYGSSVTMSNGNVSVSAARHLDLEAAGDIRLTAGGSFFAKANKHVEIVAEEGGATISGATYASLFSELGTAWIRSNADTESPTPAVPQYTVGEQRYAVVVEAPQGRSLVRTAKRQTFAVDGTAHENGAGDIVFETRGDFAAKCRDVAFYGRDLVMALQGRMAVAAKSFSAGVREFWASGVRMANGKILASSVETKSVEAEQVACNPTGFTQPPYATQIVGSHANHVLTRRSTSPIEVGEQSPEVANLAGQAAAAVNEPPVIAGWQSDGEGTRWSFLPSSEYYWDAREESQGSLVETTTQQVLRLDTTAGEDLWGGDGYEEWQSRPLLPAPRMGLRYSFGGQAQHYTSDAGETLFLPSSTAYANLAKSADWTLRRRKFYRLKS